MRNQIEQARVMRAFLYLVLWAGFEPFALLTLAVMVLRREDLASPLKMKFLRER